MSKKDLPFLFYCMEGVENINLFDGDCFERASERSDINEIQAQHDAIDTILSDREWYSIYEHDLGRDLLGDLVDSEHTEFGDSPIIPEGGIDVNWGNNTVFHLSESDILMIFQQRELNNLLYRHGTNQGSLFDETMIDLQACSDMLER